MITSDSFICGLAAAALEPGLRQVLVLDADFSDMETAASILQQLLALATNQRVHTVQMTGLTEEDDLWGCYLPTLSSAGTSIGSSGLTIAWQDGALIQNRHDKGWLLVVIPNLTRLSLSAVRTCISLLDSPVVHLERYDKKEHWQPRICWLAACARNEVGKLSPHLLDRFPLRLSSPKIRSTSSPMAILDWLHNSEKSERPLYNRYTLSKTWRNKVANIGQLPIMSKQAIQQVVAYSNSLSHPGVRRELGLSRLGRALARMEGGTLVSHLHIINAADLIGLALPGKEEKPKDVKPPSTEIKPRNYHSELESPTPQSEAQGTDLNSHVFPQENRVLDPNELEQLPPATIPINDPFPEDSAPIDRDLFMLQLPICKQRTTNSERGVIIGTQMANSLQDLALVPTILEAAQYQKIRQKFKADLTNGLILSPTDLRRYRRVPQPDKMLLLLLDYTSLIDCEWQQALIPHLRWAYINRASITVIQVGSANAIHELRAQKVVARSLLTPRISDALEAQPGQATPLAHGLEMAHQVIQKAQQHGRSLIQDTRFVVITDGRGNVPLDASAFGKVDLPVNREGIEDALKVTHQIHEMKRMQTFLLDPQPQHHAELPHNLSEALGAIYEPIPLVPAVRL